jgi:CshA-type fibril repeat protein
MGVGRVLGRVGLAIFCLVLVLPLESVEATNGVTLSASLATVAPGSTVDLTASMPVVSAGSTTQTLTQTIDPTKVRLTSASDITYPAGWTLSYSTDGTTFSSTAPTTTNGWAAITAVRATGSLESSGASNGFQVASRTATGTAATTAPASLPSTGVGDGYQAFFDPGRTRVFNLFHHGTSSDANLNCHVIATGSRCDGFPFAYGGATDEAANGVVVGSTIWAAGQDGFFCIDISAVLANTSNAVGGGSPTRCFSSGSSALVPGTSGKWLTWFSGASQLGQAQETKLYALDSTNTPNAVVYCIDTATRALCNATPSNTLIAGSALQNSFDTSSVLKVENLLYVMVANQNTRANTVTCFDVTNWTRCPGWTANFAGYTGVEGKFADIPNAQGGSRGVCYIVNDQGLAPFDPASTTCWNSAGQTFTAASVNLPPMYLGGWAVYGNPVRMGSRLYWGNGLRTTLGQVMCYDATANSNFGGRCNGETANLTSSGAFTLQNYTVTPDPLIPNCLWLTRHSSPIIITVDILSRTAGCSSLAPTTASFSGTSIVPRMGCEASSQPIRQWESFRLTSAGTGTFTAAKLTVKNSSGVAISDWTDVSLTLNTDLNLATLSPTDTGSNPTFDVAFEGITGSITTASAQVRVVGDAPQLCTKVTAVYSCPTGVGPISSLANSVASVSATGSSVLGGVTTTLTPASQTVTVTAPAISTCTSSITGRAGDAGGGASGSAISGVSVSLLDSSGNPVLVGGTPVSTTTASDGTYSFANVLPASYKLRFNEPGSQVLASSTVVSGASGTSTGTVSVMSAATTVTSNTAATVAGTNAVVNALYTIPAAATADIPPAGTQGTAQTINVLTNDTAASGATLTANSVRLCGTSPVQNPPSCSQTSLTTADGTYSVNTSTGDVTFTPTSSFTGTATVIPSYQVSDSASNVVSSTITVTIIARPTLSPDTSSGAWDTDQIISPLVNDVADSRTTLVASSVKLCGPSDTSPDCTATSLTNSDGTYTVNSDGTVTFDPVASFTGTSTNPVTYSVIDSLSQKSASTITPSVTAPGAPVANPKTKIVSPTLAASFATITGQSGLATGTQLTPARTFLCSLSPAQSPPNCNATSITTSDGTWVLSQITGVVTYQPAAGVSAGTKVAIRYQVTDAAGQSASALLTPVIPPAPIAKPDTSSGQQGISQIISLTGNDVTGSASSPLDVSTVKFCTGNQVSPNCTATSLTVTDQGTYTIDSFGIVTFIPVSGFTGTATPISYQVSDTVGQVASSTLSVNVIPPPAPIATRDTGSAAYGESVIFEPWKNDSGGSKPAGASQPAPDVVPTSIRLCSASQVAPNCTATSVGTVDGTYTLDTAIGKVTFAPVSGFSGTATAPVTYQISNNWTGPSGVATTTAILIPTIAAPGDPLATNDQSATKPLTPVILKPIANDSPGSYALKATSLRLCDDVDIAPNCSRLAVTNAQGTYVVDQNTGEVTFTPAKGFNGLASVPYVISDMNARVATANLFIAVSSVETTPANQEKATTLPKTDGSKMPKTGSSHLYTLGEIAILTYLTGTGLVSVNKWKRRKSGN